MLYPPPGCSFNLKLSVDIPNIFKNVLPTPFNFPNISSVISFFCFSDR